MLKMSGMMKWLVPKLWDPVVSSMYFNSLENYEDLATHPSPPYTHVFHAPAVSYIYNKRSFQ